MKKQDQKNFIEIPSFSVKKVSGVNFGEFAACRSLCYGSDKLYCFGKTLPEAMILAADMGKGCHLLTSFEWAALAYDWQRAKSIDDVILDMQSFLWQWVMGLFMHPDGHVDVLASLDVSYSGSPYGRGEISDSGKTTPILNVKGLRDTWKKEWAPGAFDGMQIYIAEANKGQGGFYPITVTTGNSLMLAKGSDPGNGKATFCIVRHVETDVTAGMSSGERIKSLRESDADLKAFAIPATSGSKGTMTYGNDRYWHWKGASSIRAAFRGGAFDYAAGAGVFALYLGDAPSLSDCTIGFRAAKAL